MIVTGMDETIVLVRAVQTCMACPSQWDAWDATGRYYYLRYRHGHSTVDEFASANWHAWGDSLRRVAEFYYGDELDGVISLEDFAQAAGIRLELDGREDGHVDATGA